VNDKDRRDSIGSLLKPASVAVVGVSTEATAPGARVFANLREYFGGTIGAVNVRRADIAGHPSVATLSELDFVPELVIVATPAAAVPDVLSEAGRLGTRAAIVLSAGFAEAGEEGAAAQAEIVRIAESHGMAVLGPNSVGLMSRPHGLFATFTNAVRESNSGGRVAVIGQSGGMAAIVYTILCAYGIGVDYLVALGNEAAATVGGLADWMVQPENDIDTVLGFVESLSGWKELASAARQASESGKLIALVRAGRSEVGATAAGSHIGAMAGDDAVLSEMCKAYGILEVPSLDDLADIAKARHAAGRIGGDRVGVVTASGGAGSMLADLLTDGGLTLPVLSDELQRKIYEVIPWFGSATNPVDTTAYVQSHPECFAEVSELMAASGQLDAVMVFLGTLDPIAPQLVASIAATNAAHPDVPMFAVWGGGSRLFKTQLWEAGVATYDDPARAVQGLRSLRPRRAVTAPSVARPAPRIAIGEVSTSRGRQSLGEDEVRRLLEAYDLPTVPGRLVGSPDAAAKLAADLQEPLVLKLIADEVQHKSDVGGVVLGVRGEDAVRAETARMLELATTLGVEARGVLVEQQVPSGLEMLCGFRRDPSAGPVVIVGLGGVLAEIVSTIAIRPADLTKEEALDAVGSLFGGRLLSHHRGVPATMRGVLASVICGIGRMATDLPWLIELECNPVIVTPTSIAICDGLATVEPVVTS